MRFPNSGCTSTDNLNGTCYSTEECASRGGSSAGTCAGGYGVCCTCKFIEKSISQWSGSIGRISSLHQLWWASIRELHLPSVHWIWDGSLPVQDLSVQWQHLSTEIGLFNLCHQSTRHVNYICHENGRQKLLREEPMYHRPIYSDSSWK